LLLQVTRVLRVEQYRNVGMLECHPRHYRSLQDYSFYCRRRRHRHHHRCAHTYILMLGGRQQRQQFMANYHRHRQESDDNSSKLAQSVEVSNTRHCRLTCYHYRQKKSCKLRWTFDMIVPERLAKSSAGV